MKPQPLIPMLNVSNIKASLEFYAKLGFSIVSDPEKVDQWRWASISRGMEFG